MKRILWICLSLLLVIPTFSLAAVIGPARVRIVDGDVLFRTPDSGEWLPAAINTPLDEGDAIWCPDNAKVEIQLADGSLVRIDEGSQLDLLSNEAGFTHLHLASGRAYLKTSQATVDNSLQIDADDTTVLPAARTRLRIDILPNNQEDVSIFKGSAYVEGNGNRTKVRSGEHIALEEGHSALLSLNPPDNWENWNMNRDRDLSIPTGAASHLPEELRGYSSDLDLNGSWVRVPEYGMVWRPTVIISNDWAPYRSGRWIWKGDDYVWVSFENWGWVPYHYGRWAVVSGFGWCWVPPVRGDVYWGPGYVGWYSTGSHIGWTPLAPGESFYGRRNYGRHSVNITTTSVNSSKIVYRNRQVRGGMTVLPQNDFLRGRVVSQPASGNRSVSVSVSVGSPRIQPLRETRMPIVKQTPPRIVPPRIEHRDTRDLRQRFPRVTPEAGSRQRAPQAMPAAPPGRPAQTREIQTVHPEVTGTNPSNQSQRAPQQREERRQHSPAPQANPQSAPRPSGTVPQRIEQPRQTPPPVASQPSPSTPQTRGERKPNAVPQPAIATPSGKTPPRVEKPRREMRSRELKEKKFWRVTTPEEGKDQDQKERGQREREHRER
ncbi:MAG: FecR domain-containing protein [Verrucomicrobia bacterium]|nr:FecR domain-containing protein [Deltaproteobacteria bacterium]